MHRRMLRSRKSSLPSVVDKCQTSFHDPCCTVENSRVLGLQAVSILTSFVALSRATDPQFGRRWHDSNSGHNEQHFQDQQQEVHRHSSVFAVDKGDRVSGRAVRPTLGCELGDNALSRGKRRLSRGRSCLSRQCSVWRVCSESTSPLSTSFAKP
jgi:hypothetical protein